MGIAVSKWPMSPISLFRGVKQSKISSPAVIRVYHAVTPRNGEIPSITSACWELCLEDAMQYLDICSLRNMSFVSRSLSDRFHQRGGQVCIEAIIKLLGDHHSQKLCSYASKQSDFKISSLQNRHILPGWIDACDLLIGHLHAKVPGGSQTSTSMALALVRDFLLGVNRKLPSNVSEKDIDRLRSNSYLLAFTALSISIKVEVIPDTLAGAFYLQVY